MPLYKHKMRSYPALLLFICVGWKTRTSSSHPVTHFDDNLVAYPTTPNEVLPIEPLLIYPESRDVFYQARTLEGDGERDIIFVKLLQDKSDSYRPKQQRLIGKEQQRKQLGIKDIFFVKACANGQFSDERLKVYRLPEFYAISVFRNGEK